MIDRVSPKRYPLFVHITINFCRKIIHSVILARFAVFKSISDQRYVPLSGKPIRLLYCGTVQYLYCTSISLGRSIMLRDIFAKRGV